MVEIDKPQIDKYLVGVDYPATRNDIVKHAVMAGAGPEVISVLEKLPRRDYQTPADVWTAISDLGGDRFATR